MNLNTKKILILLFFVSPIRVYAEIDGLSQIIRQAAFDTGYMFPDATHVAIDKGTAAVGEELFRSKQLSLNGNIACATCHISEKASVDGLPNAVGIHGEGESRERFYSGGKIVPRNTLALWGVGSKFFDRFFWDGRVDFLSDQIISQFGTKVPSVDPLVTAVHLPVVEIRETVDEDDFIMAQKRESVSGAKTVYDAIVMKLKRDEPKIMDSLSHVLDKPVKDLEFLDVAKAIASFMRDEFRLTNSRFSDFMAGNETLSDGELKGASVFYGKGGCVSCHSGPYFSDFNFHTVAFPQLGFGKKGFGIDYGRYNATFNPEDLYKFRTPSLNNVAITMPYGHSGSLADLEGAIYSHFDPLKFVDIKSLTPLQRHEYYKYLNRSDTFSVVNFLADDEVQALVLFLKTLTMEANP